MPSKEEADDSFETLRETHGKAMDSLFPDSYPSNTTSDSGSFPTPATSSSNFHSLQDFAKPRFNKSSADQLLESFHSMLPYFPCIVLPANASVSELASSAPFVLLSILTAASASRTLQGHSLYDDEFRKVLALKFVAGGERSIEILQGILIYCAW